MSLTLDVYIPFMACACQPGRADRHADDFNRLLLELRREFEDPLSFRVHALNVNLAQFRKVPELSRMLREEGHGSLPVIMLDGEILFAGRYPGREELVAALDKHVSR